MKVGNEKVHVCLGKAYDAQLSSTVRYKNMDTELSRRGVAIKDIYNFLVKQYEKEGITVINNSPEQRAIHLYLDHVKRFFQGSWKKHREQPKYKQGQLVKTRTKKSDKEKLESFEKSAKKRIEDDKYLEILLKVLKEAGYRVEKDSL